MILTRPKSISQIIKEGRKRTGLTQESLANLVSCSRSLIAQIERGVTPTNDVLRKIVDVLSEPEKSELSQLAQDSPESQVDEKSTTFARTQGEDDMIRQFMKIRTAADIDLSGEWEALWLTTVNGQENRNSEAIVSKRRWNGSWEFTNQAISEDNRMGGYLWIGRLELFDNKHLLGYYCAKERRILAKGTLCLELQTNGRDIVGVWNGLNFDTMWASGLVAMSKKSEESDKLELSNLLDRFVRTRPKMPY